MRVLNVYKVVLNIKYTAGGDIRTQQSVIVVADNAELAVRLAKLEWQHLDPMMVTVEILMEGVHVYSDEEKESSSKYSKHLGSPAA